jgi:hypothetical protein
MQMSADDELKILIAAQIDSLFKRYWLLSHVRLYFSSSGFS